jgi:3-hydroxyacyl-[acyl-carrier-protein] dehydratase
MHWYWIDRFTEFESGKRATAIKAITLAEDHLHDHFRYHPIMPASLIIEGVAQTGGLLVCEKHQYQEKVVLAKVPRMRFHLPEAVPGDVLTYTIIADDIRETGAMVSAKVHKGEELMAEGQLVFAYLSEGFSEKQLFEEGNLIDMMRNFRAFEVGKNADGSPLLDPAA